MVRVGARKYLNCKVQDCQPGVGVRLKVVKKKCVYTCTLIFFLHYRRVYLDQQMSLQIMQGLSYLSSLPGVR